MNILTAEQRGDLAEDMVLVAGHLAVLVHGDGGPEDVATILAELDDTQKTALLVVLAGMVDPGRPLAELLGWLNEPITNDTETLRHIAAPDPGYHCATCSCAQHDDDYIDPVVIDDYLAGRNPQITKQERLAAVLEGQRRGMHVNTIDHVAGLAKGTTEQFLYRAQTTARRPVTWSQGQLTDEQIIDIRQRSAGGETDTALALSYGVSNKSIGKIVRGESYAQVGGPLRRKRATGSSNPASKALFASGLTSIPTGTQTVETAA